MFPLMAGSLAVDRYIGATEVVENDPLNSVYPGEFNYGGGHVIEDLVVGNVAPGRRLWDGLLSGTEV